jgi:hypothetical protein
MGLPKKADEADEAPEEGVRGVVRVGTLERQSAGARVFGRLAACRQCWTGLEGEAARNGATMKARE